MQQLTWAQRDPENSAFRSSCHVSLVLLFGFQSPVPLKEIDCGDPDASSVNATVALNVPVVLGAKIRDSEQLAPAARTDPQLLVCRKELAFAPVI